MDGKITISQRMVTGSLSPKPPPTVLHICDNLSHPLPPPHTQVHANTDAGPGSQVEADLGPCPWTLCQVT